MKNIHNKHELNTRKIFNYHGENIMIYVNNVIQYKNDTSKNQRELRNIFLKHQPMFFMIMFGNINSLFINI